MGIYSMVDKIYQEKKAINLNDYNREQRGNHLIYAICKYYQVSITDLTSRSREGKIRDARNLAFYVLHKKLKITSLAVGKTFNRNHATVLSGCKRTANWMEYDKEYSQLVSTLLNQ